MSGNTSGTGGLSVAHSGNTSGTGGLSVGSTVDVHVGDGSGVLVGVLVCRIQICGVIGTVSVGSGVQVLDGTGVLVSVSTPLSHLVGEGLGEGVHVGGCTVTLAGTTVTSLGGASLSHPHTTTATTIATKTRIDPTMNALISPPPHTRCTAK
jgi:hypothetical protein